MNLAQRLRSFTKATARILAVMVTVLLIAAAGLYLRLASGPIDTPIPQSMLDRIIAEAAPGWQVEAEGAQLDFSSDDGLNGLQLRDVALIDSSGHRVVAVPRIGLRFSLKASLDPYKVLTVREVALNGAQVDVTRNADGKFLFDIGTEADSPDAGDPFATMLSDGALDILPRLRVEDAHVTYNDLKRGTTWRTQHARLTLDPSSQGLAGKLDVSLEDGKGGAVLEAFRYAKSGDTRATLQLNQITPSEIADIHPMLVELARIDAPLTGSISTRILADGSIHKLDTDLTAGAGLVRLSEGAPSPLKSFAAQFSCDADSHACNVSKLSIKSPDLSARLSGGMMQIGDRHYIGEFVLGDTVLRLSPDAAPISAASGLVTAAFDLSAGMLEVEHLALDGLTLPDGLLVELAQFTGTVNTETYQATLPQWHLEGATAQLEDGQTVSFEDVRGSASYENGTLTIPSFEADAISMRQEHTTLHTIGKLSGNAHYTVAGQQLDLRVKASGLAFTDPSLPSPIRLARLGGSGHVDLAARTLSNGRISLQDAVLPLPELYDAPIQLSSADLSLSGKISEFGYGLVLQDAQAVIDGLPVYANGAFALRKNDSYSGALEASLGPVDFARVPGHWPKPVAPGGLSWLRSNVHHGQVDTLNLTTKFDSLAPEKDSLNLSFEFRDAALSYVPGMPPITGARGKGRVTLDRLDVALSDGLVSVPNAGILELKGSQFSISDFAPDTPEGEVKLQAKGGIQSVLRLLDSEPLGIISPTGLDITQTKGRAEVRGQLKLPLADDVAMEDVRFDARAKVHKYQLHEPRTGAVVSGDLLLVKAQPEGLTLQSDARIEGLSARIGYRQEFAPQPSGMPDSVLTIESFMSLEDFARHGVDLSQYLTGLTAVNAKVDLFDNGLTRFTADADLTNLDLRVDRIGWEKPNGVPATIRLTGTQSPDGGGNVEALALRGNGMIADGGLTFDRNGTINFAQFSRIALGQALDVGLRYTTKPEGGATIRVEGPRFDLRTAFADAIEGEGAVSRLIDPNIGATTDVSFNVGRVMLQDDLTIFNTRGSIRLRNDEFNAADIEGFLNGQAPAKLRVERQSDGLALRLTSSEGGGFLQAADVFDAAQGGRLMLDARTVNTVSPSRIRGVIRIDNVTVHDSETMRDIFSDGAISSLIRDMAADGIGFEKIQMPFTGIGSTWNIENGVAYGPSLGVTLEGSYDLAARKLDLDGSVSPAYAINGALGKIPLLGQVLAGGEGEGVFGVTFSVEGDSANPTVSVNPLSAIAPGFLRRIVAEVSKGGGGTPSPQQRPYQRNDK